MNVPVPAQRRRTVKAGLADRTAIALLVRMNSHVGLHIGLGTEVFGADFTQERPYSLVFDFVSHESLPRGEHLVTFVARQVEMDGDVVAKAALASESSRTLGTGKGFLSSVNYCMHFQGCRIHENLWATVTEEGALSSVNTKVAF